MLKRESKINVNTLTDLLNMAVKELPNGMKVVNTSPHSIYLKFKNGKKRPKYIQIEPGFDDIVSVFSISTDGETLYQRDDLNVSFMSPSFELLYPDLVDKALEWAEQNDVYFISSIWTALAIPHKRVIVVVTNQRKDNRVKFKHGYGDRFTTFWKGENNSAQ